MKSCLLLLLALSAAAVVSGRVFQDGEAEPVGDNQAPTHALGQKQRFKAAAQHIRQLYESQCAALDSRS
jgi:hypothetical protein